MVLPKGKQNNYKTKGPDTKAMCLAHALAYPYGTVRVLIVLLLC